MTYLKTHPTNKFRVSLLKHQTLVFYFSLVSIVSYKQTKMQNVHIKKIKTDHRQYQTKSYTVLLDNHRTIGLKSLMFN